MLLFILLLEANHTEGGRVNQSCIDNDCSPPPPAQSGVG